MNLNKVFLVGRLTQDPESKTTTTGQTVCSFGLATNRVWTDPNTKEKKEQAEFHNIVVWRRLAELVSQYLSKGNLVLIEGRVQTRSWQDQTGNKRYKTEIVADNIQFGPKNAPQSNFQPPTSQTSSKNQPVATEEIPIIEEGAAPTSTPSASLSSETPKKDEDELDVSNIPF